MEPAFRGPYDHTFRGRPYFEAPMPEPEQLTMREHITPAQFDAALAAALAALNPPPPEEPE